MQFDGGPRSFPLASEAGLAYRHSYEPPNKEYEVLLSCQVPAKGSHVSRRPHSAGWLIADETSVCKPVFVAHSVLSAIWLLRETLADDALPGEVWEKLVVAAQNLARGSDDSWLEAPPSAQRPLSPPPLSTKRPAASTPPPLSAKRPRRSTAPPSPTTRQQLTLSPDSELAATPQLSGPSRPEDAAHGHTSYEANAHVTSVTNNNRRAELARAQRQQEAQANRKLALGLKPPAGDASRKEHIAYASLLQQDESIVSWIFRQSIDKDSDLYNSTSTPYATAFDMLDKARAVGNATSQAAAAAFLRSWCAQGTPFAQDNPDARLPALSRSGLQLSQMDPLVTTPGNVFLSAWNVCERYERELQTIHIKYRWAMAFLGKAYVETIDEIKAKDAACTKRGRNRDGRGKVSSEAMDVLLRSVSTTKMLEQRGAFRKRLHRALRWYEAAKQLGWGMLCFLPDNIISNAWVEKELRVPFWHVWLELVTKVNPVACKESRALDAWLGSDGLAGGPIHNKEMLGLEAKAKATVPSQATQITEVEDSEEEDEDEDVEEGET